MERVGNKPDQGDIWRHLAAQGALRGLVLQTRGSGGQGCECGRRPPYRINRRLAANLSADAPPCFAIAVGGAFRRWVPQRRAERGFAIFGRPVALARRKHLEGLLLAGEAPHDNPLPPPRGNAGWRGRCEVAGVFRVMGLAAFRGLRLAALQPLAQKMATRHSSEFQSDW